MGDVAGCRHFRQSTGQNHISVLGMAPKVKKKPRAPALTRRGARSAGFASDEMLAYLPVSVHNFSYLGAYLRLKKFAYFTASLKLSFSTFSVSFFPSKRLCFFLPGSVNNPPLMMKKGYSESLRSIFGPKSCVGWMEIP